MYAAFIGKEARSKTDKGIQDTGHQESENFTIRSTF